MGTPNRALAFSKAKIARTIARHVDLLHDETDFKVCTLASLGLSTKAICIQTGLSFCQVNYRLNKASIKRKDYRDGESPVAAFIMRQAQGMAAPIVKKAIVARLKELEG